MCMILSQVLNFQIVNEQINICLGPLLLLSASTINFLVITCKLILRKHFPASFLRRFCTTYDAFFRDKVIIFMEIEAGLAGLAEFIFHIQG